MTSPRFQVSSNGPQAGPRPPSDRGLDRLDATTCLSLQELGPAMDTYRHRNAPHSPTLAKHDSCRHLDTFYTGETPNRFTVNPLGGRSDWHWNGVSQFDGTRSEREDRRFDGGWTGSGFLQVDSLRPEATQVWGFTRWREAREERDLDVTLVPPRAASRVQQASSPRCSPGSKSRRAEQHRPQAVVTSKVTSDRWRGRSIHLCEGRLGSTRVRHHQNLTADSPTTRLCAVRRTSRST